MINLQQLIFTFLIVLKIITIEGSDSKCQHALEEDNLKIICINSTLAELVTYVPSINLNLRSKPVMVTIHNSVIEEISLKTLTIPGLDDPELHFQNNVINSIDINAVRRIASLKNNDIYKLVSTAEPNIFEMRFSDNTIHTIQKNTFHDLRTNIIALSNCKLGNLPPGSFDNIRDLHKIDLSNNNITEIVTNTFVNLTKSSFNLFIRLSQVTTIDLSYNNIKEIQYKAFEKILQIEKLDLSYNNLTTLKSGIFSNVKFMFLYLKYNQINQIEPHAFDDLTDLNLLDLSQNRITMLTTKMFAKLQSLYGINLIGNPITTIHPNSFFNLINLRKEPQGNGGLNLGQLNINVVDESIFHGLFTITTLDLSGWNLTLIKPNGLNGLPALTHLLLNNNQLTDIKSNTFSDLSSLDYLDLSSNKLKIIKKDAFAGINGTKYLKELETKSKQQTPTLKQILFGDMNPEEIYFNLYLQNNIIEKIEAGVFDNMINLQYINLSKNRLTKLDIGVFKGLKYMLKLDLSDNQMNTLQKEVLYPMIRLEQLDVSGNKLKELDVSSILDHMITDSLKIVNLNYNNWDCNKLETIISVLSYSKVDYVSSSPEHFHSENVHGISCDRIENVPNSEYMSSSTMAKQMVEGIQSQNTFIKLLFFTVLGSLIMMIFVSLSRNNDLRTMLHLRTSDRNLHQSTVELLNVH